ARIRVPAIPLTGPVAGDEQVGLERDPLRRGGRRDDRGNARREDVSAGRVLERVRVARGRGIVAIPAVERLRGLDVGRLGRGRLVREAGPGVETVEVEAGLHIRHGRRVDNVVRPRVQPGRSGQAVRGDLLARTARLRIPT